MQTPILAAFLSCCGPTLSDDEKRLFATANPVGVTLFSRNIVSPDQLRSLTKEIKETVGRADVLIAVDQEGGRVRRLAEPNFRPYSSQSEIGSLPLSSASEAAALHAELISADLNAMGINVNFAPVLDTFSPQTSDALRSRCFSDDHAIVALLGKTMVNRYISNGILPCIKHMPGHGHAKTDPHLELPIIDISFDRLQAEIMPFQTCNYSPLGMTAHILLPAVDPQNPLTQSPNGIKLLIRKMIGFDGLLISDSIDMKALKGTLLEKTQQTLAAGCDCVCYCMGNIADLHSLANNCPKLSDAGLERLDKALQILHNKPQTTNKKADAAQYAKLMGAVSPYQETYDATEVLNKLQTKE